MERNTNLKFAGNVIAQELMPRLGKFFNRYSLDEGCRMTDKIISAYRRSMKPVKWDDKILFLTHVVELLFDLHERWKAGQGGRDDKDDKDEEEYIIGNVA